jgi:hypothetical protein
MNWAIVFFFFFFVFCFFFLFFFAFCYINSDKNVYKVNNIYINLLQKARVS